MQLITSNKRLRDFISAQTLSTADYLQQYILQLAISTLSPRKAQKHLQVIVSRKPPLVKPKLKLYFIEFKIINWLTSLFGGPFLGGMFRLLFLHQKIDPKTFSSQ